MPQEVIAYQLGQIWMDTQIPDHRPKNLLFFLPHDADSTGRKFSLFGDVLGLGICEDTRAKPRVDTSYGGSIVLIPEFCFFFFLIFGCTGSLSLYMGFLHLQ